MKLINPIYTIYLTMLFVTLAFTQEYINKLGNELDGVFDSLLYEVDEEVIVKEGMVLEFKSGSVLSFIPYTGIKVFGHLKMKNTVLKLKDNIDKPWNGINVASSGKISFENVSISGSVFGLNIPDSSSIEKFINVHFENNDRNIRIGDKSIFIGEDNLLTIDKKSNKDEFTKESIVKVDQDNSNVKEKNPQITAMRLISAVTALTCSALCTYSAIKSEQYYGKYEKADNNIDSQKYIDNSNKFQKYSIASGIGAGVGGVSLLITLLL